MREEWLHYFWKNVKYPQLGLTTLDGDSIQVISPGQYNHHAGPDFLEAHLKISQQTWIGSIEVHINSSDWYIHKHHNDHRYANVILHVVWSDDIEDLGLKRLNIPTVALKYFVSVAQLKKQCNLERPKKRRFIICEKDIGSTNEVIRRAWLERLYIERLEDKCAEVNELLLTTKHNWEEVLYILLLRNFGIHQNKEIFYQLSRVVKHRLVLKLKDKTRSLEAILMGCSGLLEKPFSKDSYWRLLKKDYEFLKNKFQLRERLVQKPYFFRLRPASFPTIRLAQFANLYSLHSSLFSNIIRFKEMREFYTFFAVSPSEYWKTHYVFGKYSSPKREHRLSNRFIELLLINSVLPLIFCYYKWRSNSLAIDVVDMALSINPENNKITRGFDRCGVSSNNALMSQAIIQLYKNYCTKHRCLECAIGSNLLKVK